MWRAFWFAAREGFADVLGGLYGFEEALDTPPPPREVEIEKPQGTGIERLAGKVAARADAWGSCAAPAEAPGDEPAAAATEPAKASPALARSWLAWEGARFDLFRPVFDPGPWDDWADEPHGIKLLEKHKHRTWRQAAAGSRGGLREKVLAALEPKTAGSPERWAKATCTLALLQASNAAEATLEPADEPEPDVDPEIEARALAEAGQDSGDLFGSEGGDSWPEH